MVVDEQASGAVRVRRVRAVPTRGEGDREPEVGDDLLRQQADQVRVAAEPGIHPREGLGRDGGAAQHIEPFEHLDVEARLRQIGGGSEAVVAPTDDDDVAAFGHRMLLLECGALPPLGQPTCGWRAGLEPPGEGCDLLLSCDGGPMAATVSLRELTRDDARELATWQTDPTFATIAGWRPTSTIAEGEGWWRESISNPDPLLTRLGAVEAGGLVGYVDLYGEGPEERELGYLVGPSLRWGRGLGTAAAGAGIIFGFDMLGVRRLWAEAVVANVASVRVLQKLGFTPIGHGQPETFLGAASHFEQFELLRADRPIAH